MDDLAPAPAQRSGDDGGRRLEEIFPARKKTLKKAPSVPAEEENPAPQAEESDHELDVLA
jgi:hypothetical protein